MSFEWIFLLIIGGLLFIFGLIDYFTKNKLKSINNKNPQARPQGNTPPPATPKKRWWKLKKSDITSSLWIIILFCVAAILIVFALNFIYETFKEKPEQSNGNTLFGPDSLTDYGYRQGSQGSSSSSSQKVGYLQMRDTIYYGGEYGEFFEFNGRDIHFLNPSSSYCIKSTNEEEFCGRQYEDIYYKMCPNCEYTLKFKRGGNDLSPNKDSVIVLYKKFF